MSLERSIWIETTRERIWQAVTDPDQLIKWLTPNLTSIGAQMVRDDSGKLMVQFGPMSVDFAMFEVMDMPRSLTSRTLPDCIVTTTYHLEEEKGGTCLTVTVNGFESLMENADRIRLSEEGWEKALQNLKAHLDGAELPFQQAFVSPLFGYWRESQKTLSVERSIWIKASRERVWQAVTDPKQIQGWMSPTTEWQLSALEIGGRFYVHDEESNSEKYTEIIELLDAPHQLGTRTVPDSPGGVVKGKLFTLKEENGGTRLTVTLSGYEQEPEASRWNTMEENTSGFGMMLQNTKAFIEGEPLPFPFGF